MNYEKFISEIDTLKRFFEIYCDKKHKNQNIINKILSYKNHNKNISLFLCEDCYKTLSYSFDKLISCPHEEKPRCRKCPNPCYEKKQWKEVAKIMRYSGIVSGFNIVNKKIKSLTNNTK